MRSLGFSAGRKNARICHKMTGAHATTDAHRDTLKRTLKPSNGSSVVSRPWPSVFICRMSEMGHMRNRTSVSDAR